MTIKISTAYAVRRPPTHSVVVRRRARWCVTKPGAASAAACAASASAAAVATSLTPWS